MLDRLIFVALLLVATTVTGCSRDDDQVSSLRGQIDQLEAQTQQQAADARSSRDCIRGLMVTVLTLTRTAQYLDSNTLATPPGMDPEWLRPCRDTMDMHRLRVAFLHLADTLGREYRSRREA
jgi:hypothetical protein